VIGAYRRIPNFMDSGVLPLTFMHACVILQTSIFFANLMLNQQPEVNA